MWLVDVSNCCHLPLNTYLIFFPICVYCVAIPIGSSPFFSLLNFKNWIYDAKMNVERRFRILDQFIHVVEKVKNNLQKCCIRWILRSTVSSCRSSLRPRTQRRMTKRPNSQKARTAGCLTRPPPVAKRFDVVHGKYENMIDLPSRWFLFCSFEFAKGFRDTPIF